MSVKVRKKIDINILLVRKFIITINCISLMLFSKKFSFFNFFSGLIEFLKKSRSFLIPRVYLLCGRDISILLIQLFIAVRSQICTKGHFSTNGQICVKTLLHEDFFTRCQFCTIKLMHELKNYILFFILSFNLILINFFFLSLLSLTLSQ